MAEPILSAGDTPCQCTRPELSEFSRFLEDSEYPTASKGEIIRSWLAVRILLKYAPLHNLYFPLLRFLFLRYISQP